jgi:uncharacterized membrane protein
MEYPIALAIAASSLLRAVPPPPGGGVSGATALPSTIAGLAAASALNFSSPVLSAHSAMQVSRLAGGNFGNGLDLLL